MLFALTVAALGCWLSRVLQERHRKRRMRAGLPEALDLMWFYNQAGLPLDMAIAKVSKLLGNLYPDLSEELYLTSREMRSGTSWDDALYNLSERTGIDEIKTLTASGLAYFRRYACNPILSAPSTASN